jgi:hypothetical protein
MTLSATVSKPNPAMRRRSLLIAGTTIKPSDKLIAYVSRDLGRIADSI